MEAVMPKDITQLGPLIDNLEAALKSAHAAQVAALEALRKLEERSEYRPGGKSWDRELDGTGLEDVPLDVGIMTVKEAAQLLRVSQSVIYELVQTRQMPALRIGRQIRIGRRGLVAYLRGMNADEFDALIKRRAEQME
jgi:excisionase family DNA binding protein